MIVSRLIERCARIERTWTESNVRSGSRKEQKAGHLERTRHPLEALDPYAHEVLIVTEMYVSFPRCVHPTPATRISEQRPGGPKDRTVLIAANSSRPACQQRSHSRRQARTSTPSSPSSPPYPLSSPRQVASGQRRRPEGNGESVRQSERFEEYYMCIHSHYCIILAL